MYFRRKICSFMKFALRLFIFYSRICWILKYIRWKHMKLVKSKINLFIKKSILKIFAWLFIHHTILLNIDNTLLNIWPTVERLHKLFKPNNWLIKSKLKKVYCGNHLETVQMFTMIGKKRMEILEKNKNTLLKFELFVEKIWKIGKYQMEKDVVKNHKFPYSIWNVQ